jgi:methylation protein EvaC
MSCASCGSRLEPFLPFGPMPIANGFLRKEDFPGERFFDLTVAFCPACFLVQLASRVPPEALFHGSYPFFTSSSRRMSEHFQAWAESLRGSLPAKDPFVVEIGSNDGTLLEPLARSGIRHLGIEPSANVAAAARAKGVDTIERFFGTETAAAIAAERGRADAILAANCFCHIPDLNSLGEGLRALLKPGGVVAFEDPYLGDILAQTAYDQFYDEHAHYFSAGSVSAWAERHGLALVDAAPQGTHGGSLRYTLRHRGEASPSPAGAALLVREEAAGLRRAETFAAFRGRAEKSNAELTALLRRLRAEGRRVVGYAATSKSTTVFNYGGIGPDLVEFLSDTTPMKQGLFSPGVHIPVRPYAEFAARYPDYALLLAWNHAEEILAKEEGFKRAGGRWIRFVPEVGLC